METESTILEYQRKIGYSISEDDGVKVIGPPLSWNGPPPPNCCELFVRRLPKNITEYDLFHLFRIWGKIYLLRLMKNFRISLSGFAFITYIRKTDADKVMRLMNGYEIYPYIKIIITTPVEKCKLLVCINNLQIHTSKENFRKEISKYTSGVGDVILISNDSKAKSASVVYKTYREACVALDILSGHNMRLFGYHTKVDWAPTDDDDTEEPTSKVNNPHTPDSENPGASLPRIKNIPAEPTTRNLSFDDKGVAKSKKSRQKRIVPNKLEEKKIIDEAIVAGREDGFEVKEFLGKGKGVITKKNIRKDAYVLEYRGETINGAEAKRREAVYSQNADGCFLYHFKYGEEKYCIDATAETNRLGRLINHSRNGNLQTRLHIINERPHLAFFAKRDIQAGEELLYDYGDRRKAVIEALPWLKT